MRLRTPVISAACTPSQAENAIAPCSSWRCAPDLGDRRAAADHRHDALVVVVERLARLAGEVGEQVVGRPRAALQRDRAELRERARRPGRDVGDVADRVDARAARRPSGRAGRRCARRGPAASPAAPASGGRLDAAAPDDAAGPDRRAVGERDVAGRRPRSPRRRGAAARPCGRAPWRRSRAPCRRTAPSSVWPRSTRWICAARDREVVVLDASSSRGSGRRARRPVSTPVGPPPTTTKFSAPWSISAGSRSASSNTPRIRERSRCGVVERVERERVLLRAGRAEEVRLRARRQHERVAREALAVGRSSTRARRRVDRRDLAELDVDVRVRRGTACAARTRCRSARAARSPPGRAAAGTGGSCCGRSA